MEDDYLKYVKDFSVNYMSNAKWRKLFGIWAKSDVNIQFAKWSFIDSEQVLEMRLPKERELMEVRFADGLFQPFEYKWILAIKIPEIYCLDPSVGHERKQNTEELKKIAFKAGQFPIFDTEEGIEVRGYDK